MCGESWCRERSLTHRPSSQGWASGVLFFCVCCVCDFDVCIWVFVRGGASVTSFLLFCIFSFLVCYTHVFPCICRASTQLGRYMYVS